MQVYVRRADSHVELVVTDDGQGIPADLLPYVFDRFRRGDSSSSRKVGGLGLGLAIVRSIVELHEGTAALQSEGAGRGTTVVIALPTAPVRSAGSRSGLVARAVAPPKGLEALPVLIGLRIVVVDDEPEARELLRYILQESQSVVTLAENADAALAAVSEGSHDLLVSDVGMPERDGYWLIGQVRALPAGRGGLIPAVALTAYAGFGDRTHALRAGFDMHLSKPIQPAELLMVISRLAEGSRRRSAHGYERG